jgi:hypothetical protein
LSNNYFHLKIAFLIYLFFSKYIYKYIIRSMMPEHQDLMLGLCVFKVFFLSIIAYSAWMLACRAGVSKFNNKLVLGDIPYSVRDSLGYGIAGANNPVSSIEVESPLGSRSGFNNAEPPVFWNLGDVDTINKELRAAANLEFADARAELKAGVPSGTAVPTPSSGVSNFTDAQLLARSNGY